MFFSRIEATFEGVDDSMGYRKGQRYILLVSGNRIMRSDMTGQYQYRSMEYFFTVWKNIEVLPKKFINDYPTKL